MKCVGQGRFVKMTMLYWATMAFDTLLIFFKVIISESNSEIYFCTTEMLIFGRTYILSGRVEDESFLNQEHYCDNQGLNVIPYFIIVGH